MSFYMFHHFPHTTCTPGANTFSTKDLHPSWNIVLNTLVVALKSYPPLWSGGTAMKNHQWSDYSELWFISMQGMSLYGIGDHLQRTSHMCTSPLQWSPTFIIVPQHGLQIKYELNISATELAAAVAESSLLKEVGVESGAVEQFNGLLRKLPGNLTVCKNFIYPCSIL